MGFEFFAFVYEGVQSMDKKALDKETRKAIIIVVQDGQNAIIDNYARKFPHNLRYHYRVDINTSPTTNGDLIVVDANKGITLLNHCKDFSNHFKKLHKRLNFFLISEPSTLRSVRPTLIHYLINWSSHQLRSRPKEYQKL